MRTPKSLGGPFQFHSLKAAKVSEISETTSAANVPLKEKINFHIGNPLQDNHLVDLYFSLCTGLPKSVLDEGSPELENPGDLNKLSFIYDTIKNAVPYSPVGGYSVAKKPRIIGEIQHWLKNQEEPLIYSFGENSDRECILATGGRYEFVRILFSVLSGFSAVLPVHLITVDFELPFYLKEFEGIEPLLDFSGNISKSVFEKTLSVGSKQPILVLIGKQPGEKERRILRKASEKNQMLFIELFDAPNHTSLARESGLKDSVIRFLTPAIFDKQINKNATQFILGNATILKLVESVHFKLKGTPSSTEKDLLEYSLNRIKEEKKAGQFTSANFENAPAPFQDRFSINLNTYFQNVENRYNSFSSTLEKFSASLLTKSQKQLKRFKKQNETNLLNDEMEFENTVDLFSKLSTTGLPTIENAFLGQFIKHNPQYDFQHCFAVSGSSRTALSLLGRHCGINEVVTFDWSWSYENGFKKVVTVPLFANGTLNTDGLINKVKDKINQDPQWKKSGAVIINNPHNASGNILDERAISKLLIDLLDQNIIIIDDLCYQDVAPTKTEIKINTVKEIALAAVQKGLLSSEKIKYIITSHALSKTDCFAGARLTVVELALPQLKQVFSEIIRYIQPNSMALFLAYLFYRNDHVSLKRFWAYRNYIFAERAEGIKSAFDELPAERNPFSISLKLPSGSMYPHLIIEKFPNGVSTENISVKLAQRGIGLIPLTTFSKTAQGYSGARNAFRLSLGGKDNPGTLKNKTRRLIIEMNRLLNEESRDYLRLKHSVVSEKVVLPVFDKAVKEWKSLSAKIEKAALAGFRKTAIKLEATDQQKRFSGSFLPWRLSILNKRFDDCLNLNSGLLKKIQAQKSETIARQLKSELLKDEFALRQEQFKERLFDRTVHPTQMYSLNVDILANEVFETLFFDLGKKKINTQKIADEIIDEYFGINVPINSEQEAFELIYDLKALVQTELYSGPGPKTLLSFWGDWDGSTRPSGQGHRLVAAVLLENVKQMARFLVTLHKHDPEIKIEPGLVTQLKNLQKGMDRFWRLLNKITRLTNQLEKKYRGLLPKDLQGSRVHRLAVKLKLRRDPLAVLFSHNSRLEKRMLTLRQQRKSSLEYYFELNRTLRKKLFSIIPKIVGHTDNPQIALLASSYRNLLSRFALTPRIHQKTITSKDSFTIENTVHNLLEINQIGDRFGNPGIIMALQISMSSRSNALIELNRLIAGKTELINRENPERNIKGFWLIPLFEEEDILNNLQEYLDDVWTYAEQSRFIKQFASDRFQEIVCEIFIAGSDLSQQVGQAKSLELFKETKFLFYKWLAQKGMIGNVRIKLGCGEPMQRQGGYYTDLSGKPVLHRAFELEDIPNHLLKPAAQKSLQYASTPLIGLHSGGELRTVQSNAAEHIFRFINSEERSQLFYHISQSQKLYKNDLLRVGKLFQQTRLNLEEKGISELRRLNHLSDNTVLKEFLKKNKESFRQILYGKDKDVVGIHAVSYFISQMVPTLRDRPTVRPSQEASQLAGQKIVERIAQTLPFSHHGSLLRAIGHNRAQSMILGINQLSTGLFRSLKLISDQFGVSKVGPLLSVLPVREILHSLRIYQQDGLKYIKQLAPAFKTGNSALHALDEDFEFMQEFIPFLQKEFAARQGLSPTDFFDKNVFKIDLLPFLRPDIAILLQQDLFNTRLESLISKISTAMSDDWLMEITSLLELPERIKKWRARTWDLIGKNIFHQVSSFIDLATALTTLASNVSGKELSVDLGQSRSSRLINQVNTLLRGASDDSMRQFLHSVVEYISRLPQDNAQLPIDTIRVLRDIERIVKIDEQLLTRKEQSKLRFYILQMARLAGENG